MRNSYASRRAQAIVFYCDLDKLREHLIEISPDDSKQIKRLIASAKAMSRCAIPAGSPANFKEFRELLKALIFFIPQLISNAKTSLGAFASGLKSADLAEAFRSYYGYAKLDDLPLFVVLMNLAQHHLKNAGWPHGGSLALARSVEKRYIELGGSINYGRRVEKIIVSNGKAAGVRLDNGEERMADYVISAADAHATLDTMLEGRFTPPEYKDAFLNEKLIPPVVQVSLGVDMDFSGVPHNQVITLKEPVILAGIAYDRLNIKHYCYDPEMAPEGKSVVIVMLETEYEVWEKLREDRQRYAAEKESAAAQVIACLDERYPGFAGKVEVKDVATPLTTQRFTGNYEGSPQGWQTTVGHIGNLPAKIGLGNFYMAGQWVRRGGGIPGGAISAFDTVKMLCKDSGRRFK